MIDILPENPALGADIETLLDTAFGPGRRRKTSYRYRDGIAPLDSLCFTAHQRNARRSLVGTVRHWPIRLDAEGAALKVVLLGPIAVDPALKATGIGGRLMHHAIDAARDQGIDLIALVGDPAYYRRFGFQPAEPFGITMPGEARSRLQILPLTEAAAAITSGGAILRVDTFRRPNAA